MANLITKGRRLRVSADDAVREAFTQCRRPERWRVGEPDLANGFRILSSSAVVIPWRITAIQYAGSAATIRRAAGCSHRMSVGSRWIS